MFHKRIGCLGEKRGGDAIPIPIIYLQDSRVVRHGVPARPFRQPSACGDTPSDHAAKIRVVARNTKLFLLKILYCTKQDYSQSRTYSDRESIKSLTFASLTALLASCPYLNQLPTIIPSHLRIVVCAVSRVTPAPTITGKSPTVFLN